MTAPDKPRVVVAISGASGALYAIKAMELLRDLGEHEIHLIISPAGARTIVEETDFSRAQVEALAHHRHAFRDIGSPLASGSFVVQGMLIAPCSARTLGAIASSLGGNLVVRAADVCLKERRRLVLLFRETPLHLGHIELMANVTRYGAIVMPPVPAFYMRPGSIEELVTQTAARALEVLGIPMKAMKRWPVDRAAKPARSTAVEPRVVVPQAVASAAVASAADEPRGNADDEQYSQ